MEKSIPGSGVGLRTWYLAAATIILIRGDDVRPASRRHPHRQAAALSRPALWRGGWHAHPLLPTRLAVRSAALDQRRHMVTNYLMLDRFKNAQVL